ncbi:Phosphoribosylamine--glycine ligase [hydrothermal vent metagenome]|uniref:phosphoribosylamine--glycine ligase n=1 Tax=hydrothermal vent metagenome TaxID=652676 RepID=A0A3B0RVT3_9ZZZZ
MNILLIGSGGREHALAWKMKQSPLCDRLFCAPSNGGINAIAEPVELDVDDHRAVTIFAKDNDIGLVVVGPEGPLVAGLADELIAAGIRVFGPSAKAAQLEGSKGFTKDICAKYNIPTAAYGRFGDEAAALAYLAKQNIPVVVKADGLAAGKGVIVATTMAEAETAVKDIFAGMFGTAGAEVVIEDCLVGEEASFFALCDGETAVPLATAQDHKQVGEGDTGPNTGGMGAYSPAPVMTPQMCKRTMDEIILPTVQAMKDLGTPFKGVFFAGLMITDNGPELIEYNVRFGDPECQVLMMQLESDLVALLVAAADGKLAGVETHWRDDVALSVVMAAKGYPGSYDKGSQIGNLNAASAADGVEIFHAGTKVEDGKTLAIGGRVLNVTALGTNVSQARQVAYQAVEKVDWPEGFYRSDIGWRAVKREKV